MKRFFLVLSGTLFSILLGVFFTGYSASAASIYDGAYKTIDNLYLYSNFYEQSADVSLNWGNLITEDSMTGLGDARFNKSGQALQDIRDSFIASTGVDATGYWAVSIYNQGTYSQITIAWSEAKTLKAEWFQDAVYVSGWDYIASIGPEFAGSGLYQVDFYSAGQVSDPTISLRNDDERNYIAYLDPNYPTGYEGEELQETPPSSGIPQYPVGGGFNPTSDFWVDDLNFEIIDTTEQALIESFKIDMCMFQLPDNTYGDTFTEYIYDCTSPVKVEHTFPELGSYNVIQRMYSSEEDLWYESTLVVKIDGSSYTGSIGDITTGLFENCLKSEFPFVDVSACIENVKAVGSLLSFNTIAFGNYDFSNECRNLEVLGFWLHLENKTVCPQVPATIRNIITPFVTFIFGLLGLKFITNRGEGGFN